MAIPIIESALQVITEGIKYLTLMQKTTRVRKMIAAVKWATEFISLTEEIMNTQDERVIKKLLTRRRYAERKFEKYKCY